MWLLLAPAWLAPQLLLYYVSATFLLSTGGTVLAQQLATASCSSLALLLPHPDVHQTQRSQAKSVACVL